MKLPDYLNPEKEPHSLLEILLSESYQLDKKYRQAYNDIAKRNHPLQAFAFLVQAKTGINELLNSTTSEENQFIFGHLHPEDYSLHSDVLIKLIATIVDEGYPKKLNILLEEDFKSELQNKVGRPLDRVAPQQEIDKIVTKLSREDRFRNSHGDPKPTTIRDELVRSYPELVGDLSERTVFDRVKKSLKKQYMQ